MITMLDYHHQNRQKNGADQNQGSWKRVFHRDVARQHTPLVADFLSEDDNDNYFLVLLISDEAHTLR